MTALEDALASPAPVWVQPELHVLIGDDGSGYHGDGTMQDFGEQLGDDYSVGQSLDDALPDPVTMTSSVDPYGTIQAELIGKPQSVATSWGFRTADAAANGATTEILGGCDFPATAVAGDYVIVAISTTPATSITQIEPDSFYGLDLLFTQVDDGADVSLSVYGKRLTPNMEGMWIDVDFGDLVAWSAVSTAVYARQVDGRQVHIRVRDAAGTNQTGTSTTHTAPEVVLERRGYVVGVWARSQSGTGATWTAPSGDTEIAEMVGAAATNVALAITGSPLSDDGHYTKTGTTSGSTALVCMAALAIELVDQPGGMPARSYFSPFNHDSPIIGMPRDTNYTTLDFGVLTTDGPEFVPLFTGQSTDMPVKGDTASLEAISATRMAFMRVAKPPVVWANKSGLNITWLLSYLMSQAGFYAGPGPEAITRWWAPMHGSLQAHFDGGGSSYYYAYKWDELGLRNHRPPESVEGPFLLGMFAEQTNDETVELNWSFEPSAEMHPAFKATHGEVALYDQMSDASAWGRIQMWVKGDAHVVSPPAYVDAPADGVVSYVLKLLQSDGVTTNAYVNPGIRNSDRAIYIAMGDDTAGYFITTSGFTLPSDGDWHYVAWSWNWKTAETRFQLDGSSTTFNGVGMPTTDANLPDTDADWIAAGHKKLNTLTSRLPIAEVEVASGLLAHTSPFPWDPTLIEPNVLIRPLEAELEVLVEATAREVWAMIAEVAQGTLSAYRADELDLFNFLPLSYFGEAAQMTSTEVVSTEINAAALEVTLDPTMTRNVVTVEFDEVRVDDRHSMVLNNTTSTRIVKGISVMTFPLDITTAEVYGARTPSPTWVFSNLTAVQVTNKTMPLNNHYVSLNSKQDGTGTYYTTTDIQVKILSADAFSVTVQFNNRTNGARFLANNGDSVPFMCVYGYAVRESVGYETRRDPASVTTRRERELSVKIPMVQRRYEAGQIASLLVAMLCRPRAQVSVTVMGDPTRKPGDLVTIADAQSTAVEGTWRILTIDHKRSGASYTQDLTLVYVMPIALWDDSNWDEGVWGE
jgi:hypothetical protein